MLKPASDRSGIRPSWWLAALILGAHACRDHPAQPPPGPYLPPLEQYRLVPEAGDGQTATVGSPLPVAPAVRLVNEAGMPVVNGEVVFAVVVGGGSVGGGGQLTVRTRETGRAEAPWTLGTGAGTNRLRVSAPLADNTVEYTAEGTPGPLARLVQAGGGNAARVTMTLGPMAVQATDAYGNGISGVRVRFALGPEGGALSPPESAVSGLAGLAVGGRWTLGTKAGPYTLVASADGIPPLVITATAWPGPAAALVIVEGDAQTAMVMTRVAIPPAVRVTDAYGNGIWDRIEVWFRVEPGLDAYVSGPAQRTDANGEARVDWQLGRRPGPYALHVTVGPLSATFTATAVVGPPARLIILEGDRQTGTAGAPLPVRPAVQVADIWSNPVAVGGIAVTFTAIGNSGSVADAVQLTDANGVARSGLWTIGPTKIPLGNLMQVVAAGLWPTSFVATGQ